MVLTFEHHFKNVFYHYLLRAAFQNSKSIDSISTSSYHHIVSCPRFMIIVVARSPQLAMIHLIRCNAIFANPHLFLYLNLKSPRRNILCVDKTQFCAAQPSLCRYKSIKIKSPRRTNLCVDKTRIAAAQPSLCRENQIPAALPSLCR